MKNYIISFLQGVGKALREQVTQARTCGGEERLSARQAEGAENAKAKEEAVLLCSKNPERYLGRCERDG